MFNAFWQHLSEQISEIELDLFSDVKISKNAKIPNETEIKDIQDKLELFYIPVQNII